MRGEGDDDTINSGAGIDTMDGGPGADRLLNPFEPDQIIRDAADTVSDLGGTPVSAASGPARGLFASNVTGALPAPLANGLRRWADRLRALDRPLPVGDARLGTLLGDIVSRGLVQRVEAYVSATANPTVEGLTAVLRRLSATTADGTLTVDVDPASVVPARDSQGTRFALRFRASRTSATTLQNLGAINHGVQGTAGERVAVALIASVDLELTFGVDAAQQFFVQLPASGLGVRTSIAASALKLPFSVGQLAAATDDGSVFMDATTTVTATDDDRDGRLRPADFAADRVQVRRSGYVFAQLPFRASLGRLAEVGAVSIARPDLTREIVESAVPADLSQATVQLQQAVAEQGITIHGSRHVQALARVSAHAIAAWLTELGQWLDRAATSPALAARFPFAGTLQLSEIADFARAYRIHALDVLVTADGKPRFRTAAELTDRLAQGPLAGAPAIGLDYNPQTRELTFKIQFGHSLQRQGPLAVSAAVPGRTALQISGAAQLSVSGKIAAALEFGIDLSASAELLARRFFVRDVSFKASVQARADNVTGSARLGLVALDMTAGRAAADVGVSLGVSGVKARLSELTVAPRVNGSAEVRLPVRMSAQVAGVTLPAETHLLVNWPDVTRPESLSAQVSPQGNLLDSRRSMAVSQFAEGLGKVIAFLRRVQSAGVFQARLPILNRSLGELIDVAEKLEVLKRQIEADPPASLDEILALVNRTLGSAVAAVRLNGTVWEFDLHHCSTWQFGYVNESTHAFLRAVINLTTDLPASTGTFHAGSFRLNADAVRDPAHLGKLIPAVAPTSGGPSEQERASVRDIERRSGLSIPLLQSPAQVFNLLLGQEVTLVTYTTPTLDLGFRYQQFFPILGPLGATLAGEVGVRGALQFGYDTRRLRQFARGGYRDPQRRRGQRRPARRRRRRPALRPDIPDCQRPEDW